MGKGSIYSQNIDTQDLPSFIKKNALNDSCNYLHDKWRDDKDRLIQHIYFSISLSLTIFASLFINWLSILILLNLLILLLIHHTIKFNKQKRQFEKNRVVMKKSFKEWGLKWKES
jgi:hypothetical protein